MKQFYLKKFFMLTFAILMFGTSSLIAQSFDKENIEKLNEEVPVLVKNATGFQNTFKGIDANRGGALQPRSSFTVLVASPNAEEFNNLVLPILQGFGDNITYTASADLGTLTTEQMLEYDMVWTFNITRWEYETGITSPAEWSDKLGAYIDAGGRLLECEFVQGYDDWGLGSGSYIDENKSPFTKSTTDASGSGGSMGEVALPTHPIMSGVNTFSTDYFYQDVTVREGATLVASYADGTPLCAFNDQIVAFNADPVGSYGGGSTAISLQGDGYQMMYNALVYLYSTLAPEGSPGAVTDVVATPEAGGGTSVALSWKNPTVTAQGETLTSLTAINIYIDDAETPSHTITNPTIGGNASWTATGLNNGVVNFTIVGENENGEGRPYTISTFVGFDVPAAVTDLTLTSEEENGKLTWTAPTTGLHNGTMGSSAINYKIVRLPDETVVATDHTTTTFIDNTVPGLGLYSYQVIASNAQGEGGSAISNTTMLGNAITPPYSMGFEDNEQYSLWTVIDNNGDGSTWSRQTNLSGYDGNAMRYQYSSSNPADDWLITPKIQLEGGQAYSINLSAAKNNSYYTESFKVFIGTEPTLEAMTTEILSVGHEGETQVTTAYQLFETTATIATAGEYYIGIQSTSAANQFYLYIDDFEIFQLVDYDLKAVSISGPQSAIVNTETGFSVNIKNMGVNSASGYTVNIIDQDNNIVATANAADCPELATGEGAVIPIAFTPTAAADLVLKGQIVWSSDADQSNNITPNELELTVVEDTGEFTVTLGDGSIWDKYTPICFYYNNSFSQTIYYADQINLAGGTVMELTYFADFATEVVDKNIKIWMANTTADNVETWLPQDDFVLVFDGTKTFPAGQSEITFNITPGTFVYNGGNLAVMVEKLDNMWINNNKFAHTNDAQGRVCAMYYRSDSAPFDGSQAGTAENKFANAKIRFATEGGSISGVVLNSTTNDPVEGATVSYDDHLVSTTTNANGEYSFDFVMTGEHTLVAEKFGYFTSDPVTTNVVADEESVVNLSITPMPQVTVTGTVRPSDDPTSGIANATITLEGFENYEATSGTNGVFNIENVYAEQTYTLAIDAEGYFPYNDTIEVTSTNDIFDLGDIVLELIECNPVENLQATVDGNVVTLTWQAGNGGDEPSEEITEGFEGESLPEGWTINSLDAITWEHVGTIEFSSGPVIPHEGEKQMNCHWSFGDQDEWLISPEFTMPTGATLTFWTYLTLGSTNGDHYYVKVSTDGGTTWTEVWDGSTEPAGPNHYDAAINVDLSTYGGQDVKVAWHAYAIGGMWYSWFIDDVTIASSKEVLSFNGRDIVREPVVVSITDTREHLNKGLASLRVLDNRVDGITIIKTRNRDIEKGSAKVVLEAHDVWNDGSGYQFLLDADHNTFGTIIPTTGPLFEVTPPSEDFYTANFEYTIPEGAEPDTYTTNIVFDGEDAVVIPAGLYDWCITNPEPGTKMWIAADAGPHPARADDYEFEGGYEYRFIMNMYGQNDGTELILDDFAEGMGYAYNIYRDNELIGTVSELTYVDEGVGAGEHTYCVETIYGEECAADQVCVNVEVIPTDCDAIENLDATVEGNVVTLTWTYQGNDDDDGEEATLSWSGPFDNNAIGTNGAADFDVAHRFEVSDLTDYVGWKLTKITFYPYEQFCDYSLRAWTGSNAANMVLDQPVSDVVIGGENTVAVETDVTIEANQEFWIGYRCNATAGFPAGVDAGPAVTGKGDMIKFDGVWDNISGMGLSYNFVIVGTIVNSKGETAELTFNTNESINGRSVVLSEDFEGGAIPSDWTQIDADGDGNMWMISPVSHGTGANCVTSESYINYVGALTPDNYLITPELSLPEGGTLTYWVCAQDGAYPYDHYGIFYSTTGNGVNDFNTTPLFEETLTAKHVGPKGDRGTNDLGTWYERTVELPAGTKYVAFRHFNCTDAFRMNIDEVVISTEGGNIDPPTDVTFNIYRDGALIATTTSFEYVDEDLNEGTYEYCVEVVCSENNVSDQVCTEATVGGDLCNPVRNLEGEVDDNVVTLTWDYPEGYAPPQEETLSWSGPFDNNAIGTNGAADFDVAHRFEVSDLTDYVGWKLTKITFYPYEQFCDYSLRAWTGSNAANMVLDQPVSDVVIGGENTVAVETDVTIEANQEFWIGYRCNATAGFPAGVDAGPAVTGKGDMIKFDGVWDNISGMGLSYNFAIVGTIVSSKGDVANITINDAPNRVFEGELAITNRPSLAIKEQVTQTNTRTRALTGYKILLDNEEIATINDPTVNTFTDDFSFAKEDVEYCVQAIYSTCESENVCESVTITGIEGNSNLSVYPNPANSIVNIDGVSVEKVYVYNNIGQLVEMLSSNQVNVSSYAKGVYMFNIVSVDGEVHKVKVVVH
ncbi:MAG: choice-of-anchor J domain-containing protein [Bacteroidales bacterium]